MQIILKKVASAAYAQEILRLTSLFHVKTFNQKVSSWLLVEWSVRSQFLSSLQNKFRTHQHDIHTSNNFVFNLKTVSYFKNKQASFAIMIHF